MGKNVENMMAYIFWFRVFIAFTHFFPHRNHKTGKKLAKLVGGKKPPRLKEKTAFN